MNFILFTITVLIWGSTWYVYSLLYLAIFGSVIGFTTYLLLVKRIGAPHAAYSTVLFPVVAIVLSAIFEDYTITSTTVLGIFLTMVGNIIMFSKINLFFAK